MRFLSLHASATFSDLYALVTLITGVIPHLSETIATQLIRMLQWRCVGCLAFQRLLLRVTKSRNPTCRMGVYGLQKFLQKGVPNEYCRKVDVKELAAAYRDETGREPVLLVDGCNCLRSACLCCFKTKEMLLGGQMQEFINNMKDFLTAFQVTEDPNSFLANF